ncbi:hypothetical protein G210_0012, partial [Candida maltosa Xu316]
MTDANINQDETYDPLEFVDPVEVLNKFPNDFDTRISSAKWKDRKEVLEEIIPILEKSPKLVTTTDYSHVIRVFAKCMKDANIQVVQLAANCIEFFIKGLNKDFHKYQNMVLAPVVERLKEKKPSVATALDNVLDELFLISGFHGVLEDAVNGMKLKTPQNKIASANYIKRCLSTTKTAPKTNEIDLIMENGVKLLSESQEPIRQAATEMIGTLMKITGPREVNSFLEKVDENRKSKINDYYENKAQVKAISTAKPPRSVGVGSGGAGGVGARPSGQAPQDKRVSTVSASTIPAKRTASSPVKRDDIKTGRGMTARALPKQPISRPPSMRPPTAPSPSTVAAVSSDEVAYLKQQLAKLEDENKTYQREQEVTKKTISDLEEANKNYQDKIEFLKRELENEKRNSMITANQKENQITNLKMQMEKADYKIKELEREKEINNLQQANLAYQRSSTSSRNSFYKPVDKFSSSSTSNDISTGVKRLSIGEENANNVDTNRVNNFRSSVNYGNPAVLSGSHHQNGTSPSSVTNGYNNNSSNRDPTSTSSMDVDNGADWKRAAEVTMQLKARIERMKARTRAPLNIE